ncbi:prophage endopeptidase tail family protein [Paenibacillus senegalimassiliensis]|uniref:prophage endopeptidase tail family protein n=1 Tax=Paenibacillus senegalimassiliensis TaxID=1737426 RepID=UPI00073E257E|nr:prophage endopeptidase tail family protein [Paenibacillus senegalimassiliensis]
MIIILDNQRRPVAVLDNYFDDEITESINAGYVLKFSICLDEEKSPHIQVGNFAEAEGQWFNIIRSRRTRASDGMVVIVAECEQVGYDLLLTRFEGGFIHTGSPAALLSRALEGTGFSVGSVEPTGIISVAIKENMDARAVVRIIAEHCEGELRYDRYNVSILASRGRNRGTQFALGKNIKGIVKDVNGQSGEIKTAYEIDVVELRTLPEFAGLEEFELGDVVQIVDEELGINEEQRIIQYSYSPKRRINSKVVIANNIRGIQDEIYRIRTTTVGKDKWMYGVKIGPDEGIVIERYDKMARSKWNADEFRMQKGNGSGSYQDALYFDPINGEYEFTGIVTASKFRGGSIEIGNNFSVDESGHMKAVGGEFSGEISASIINGGRIYGSYIEGAEIDGGVVTGALIRTAASGRRIEMDDYSFRSFDSTNRERVTLGYNTGAGMGGFVFWGPNGQSEGQVYSISGGMHVIADNELFLRSYGDVLIQGDARFYDVVRMGSIVDVEQTIIDIMEHIGM